MQNTDSRHYHFFRADAVNTTELCTILRNYAHLDITEEIRFAVTKRYVDGDVLPYRDYSLLQNSPLLLAAVIIRLPAVALPIIIIFDYPGLTIQREERKREVEDLLSSLTASPRRKLKMHYNVQPIDVTRELSNERTARTIFAQDFTDLTADSVKDLLRRMA